MTVLEARALAEDTLTRCRTMNASVEHAESSRASVLASVIVDLCDQLAVTYDQLERADVICRCEMPVIFARPSGVRICATCGAPAPIPKDAPKERP